MSIDCNLSACVRFQNVNLSTCRHFEIFTLWNPFLSSFREMQKPFLGRQTSKTEPSLPFPWRHCCVNGALGNTFPCVTDSSLERIKLCRKIHVGSKETCQEKQISAHTLANVLFDSTRRFCTSFLTSVPWGYRWLFRLSEFCSLL